MNELNCFLGDSIYKLLYVHSDICGEPLSDLDDVLFCDDVDIPDVKVDQLKCLLTMKTDFKSVFVSVEASKLLAAWGVIDGLDYFNYFIENSIYLDFKVQPNRLYPSCDDIFTDILSSCVNYYSRIKDRVYIVKYDDLNRELEKQLILLASKVIDLIGNSVDFDMTFFLKMQNHYNWRELEPLLKVKLNYLNSLNDDNLSKLLNLRALRELLKQWEVKL